MGEPFEGFKDAAGDAAIIRRKKQAIEDYILDMADVSRTTVVRDPERAKKLEHSLAEVVEITAKLAVLQEAVPAGALRNAIIFFSGVKKTPEGDTKLTPQTGANFAPSPIGFLDPTTVGLKRNFYLPPGLTPIIPEVADRVGLGLPEQRAEDTQAAIERAGGRFDSVRATARATVAGESNETLQDLVEKRGGLTRAGALRAMGVGSTAELELAAAEELGRRANRDNPLPVFTGDITGRERPTPATVDAAPPVDTLPLELQHATEIDRLFEANPPDP